MCLKVGTVYIVVSGDTFNLLFCSIIFQGQLSEEEEVLQWLITQKTEDRIELITRQMLETMVEETQYLAVYFCKSKHKQFIVLNKILLLFCYHHPSV